MVLSIDGPVGDGVGDGFDTVGVVEGVEIVGIVDTVSTDEDALGVVTTEGDALGVTINVGGALDTGKDGDAVVAGPLIFWYRLSLWPAPQYSVALPVESMSTCHAELIKGYR